MTRVLVWKELREQWTSLAVLAVLGTGLVVSHAVYAAPNSGKAENTAVLLACLTWVCGLVAGAQPLAGEREAGTLAWLDALPVTRHRLWRAKSAAAAGIAAAVTILLVACAVGLSGFGPNERAAEFILPLPLFGLHGLACGLFGSAMARTTLGAFGWALAAQAVVGTVLALLVALVANTVGRSPVAGTLIVALAVGLAAVPLAISARRFSRLDRLRRRADRRATAPVGDWRAVAWLTWRQGRAALWMVGLSGLVLAVLVPPIAPHLWPLFGLLLGLISGVGTFGADQAGSACRFLGDRRLPPGRVWLVKQAVRLAPLAVVMAVYFAIGGLRTLAADIGSVGADRDFQAELLRRQYDPSLLLFGPVVGYALGQFVGLVSRKAAVAAVITLLTGVAVELLWLPSLTVGGVHFWQWLGPPLLLLAATRPAVWPWATGRLAGLRPAVGLTAAALLAAAGTAAGIAYRVVEVPVRDEPFDAAAFERSLPTPERNAAGRAISRAIAHYRDRLAVVNAESEWKQAAGFEDWTSTSRVQEALTAGRWPADADLDRWLDAVLQGGWLDELRQAVKLPPGMVTFGGRTPQTIDYAAMRQAFSAGTFVLGRGLRRTVRGEIEPAAEDFELVLDYCRHLRGKAIDEQFLGAAGLESQVMDLLPEWAVRAADRPELIRRMIDKLRSHEAGLPPLSDTVKMDYLAALDHELNRRFATDLLPHDIEVHLYSAALAAPWEQYRSRGILNALFAGLLRTAERSYPDALGRIAAAGGGSSDRLWILDAWTPPAGDEAAGEPLRGYPAARRRLGELLRSSPWGNAPAFGGPTVFAQEARTRTQTRASELQLALILYQIRSDEPAADLSALVPDMLPALPADPFGDGPFKYRVSAGEQVTWVRRVDVPTVRDVPAGQGVLWSVGPDLRDDGGWTNDTAAWRFPGWQPGADMLFLVPVVPRRE